MVWLNSCKLSEHMRKQIKLGKGGFALPWLIAVTILGCQDKNASMSPYGSTNPVSGESRGENIPALESKLANVTAERDKLKAELAALKKTDNYYYQQVVALRKQGKLTTSTATARDLLQKFPQTSLRSAVQKLVFQNQEDIGKKSVYRRSKRL